jgi:hypothetical protein
VSASITATDRVKAAPRAQRGLGERIGIDRIDVVIGLSILALALALDLYRLGAPAVWYDESVSLNIARSPAAAPNGLFSWLPVINMALYYTILFGWVHALAWLGITTNEFLARVPSVVFGVLSVGVLYLLGKRFAGRTAGTVAALLYSVSAVQLTAAHTARAYSLQMLLVLIAWYACLALLARDGGRRWWIVYVVASVLAFTAQAVTVFVIAAQAAAFVLLLVVPSAWRSRARSRLPGMCLSLAAIGAVIVPLLYEGIDHPRMTLWLPAPTPSTVTHLLNTYLSNSSRLALLLVIAIGLLALVRIVVARWYGAPRADVVPYRLKSALVWDQSALPMGLALALACWVAVPLACSYVTSHLTIQHTFAKRYLTEVLPGVLLFVGVAVQLIGWRKVVGAALVGASLLGTSSYYASAQIEDMRTPATWIVQRYQPGDGIVCRVGGAAPGCADDALSYYLYALHADQLATTTVPSAPPTDSWTEVAAYAAQHQRVFFFYDHYIAGGDAAGAHALQRQLDSHFTLVERFTSGDAVVSLYATGTAAEGASSKPSRPLPTSGMLMRTGSMLAIRGWRPCMRGAGIA